MSDALSLEEKIIAMFTLNPEAVEELGKIARRVEDVLGSRSTDEKTMIKEVMSRFMEHTKKSVLISEPDQRLAESLKLRLSAENYRVIPGHTVEELTKFYNDRLTEEFHLTGIIAGYESATEGRERFLSVQSILEKTVTPCISITHRETEFNKTFKNYPAHTPPPVLKVHQDLDRIFGELRLAEQHSHHDTVVRVRIDDAEEQGRDIPKMYEEAEWKRRKGMWREAVALYSQILQIHRYEMRSITAYAGLLLRRKMRRDALPKEFSDGLEGLIGFLQEKRKASSVTEISYLLGKAFVILYDEKNASAPESERAHAKKDNEVLLQQGLGHLHEYMKSDPRAYYNYDALAYLVQAYVLEGSPENAERANDLIKRIIKQADPLSEPLTPRSNVELEIMQIFDQREVNVQGSRLMQLTGLNRVYELSDDLVAKRYKAPVSVDRAVNECKNLNELAEVADKLKIKIGAEEEQLGLPGSATLLGKQLDTEFYDIFEIMPRVRGRQLAKYFEDLNALAKDPEAEKKLKTSIDETKVGHLEWVIDACAKLQVIGTEHLTNLTDVRKKRHTIHLGGTHYRQVGFYIRRVFTKLIEGEIRPTTLQEERKPRVLLGREKKKELRYLLSNLEDELLNSPEWLWLFYTDSNIRNYLVEYTGENPNVHVDLITHSRKSRVDLENRDKRLGIADAITAVEHELVGFNTPSKSVMNDYLLNRWLTRVVIDRLQGYWSNCTEQVSEEQRKAYDDFKQRATAVLDTETNGKRRANIRELLTTYLPRIHPNFTLDKFRRLQQIESLFRHMTIVGDKDGEVELVGQVISQMEKKYPELERYKPLGTFKQEYERLDKLEGSERKDTYQIHKAYSKYKAFCEDLLSDKTHHMGYVKRRLEDLNAPRIRNFLINYIGWKDLAQNDKNT